MSTKKLERTVIEGGRYGYNKWERRQSSRSQRAKTREYLSKLKKNPELAEDEVEPERQKVYKDFNDKLGPMFRWLHAQVGRPWSEVRSEVFQKFDTRTTAGRHITFDHLLRSVDEVPNLASYIYYNAPLDYDPFTETKYSENAFYVDDEGILRNKKRLFSPKRIPVHTQVLCDWLKGRVIGRVGNKLFWFVPAVKGGFAEEWKVAWGPSYNVYNGDLARYGKPEYYVLKYCPIYSLDRMQVLDYKPTWFLITYFNVRQSEEFSKEDYELWETVPEWCQEILLSFSPTYSKKK